MILVGILCHSCFHLVKFSLLDVILRKAFINNVIFLLFLGIFFGFFTQIPKRAHLYSSDGQHEVDDSGGCHGDEHEVFPTEAAGDPARRDLQHDVAPEEGRQDGVLRAAAPVENLVKRNDSLQWIYCKA